MQRLDLHVLVLNAGRVPDGGFGKFLQHGDEFAPQYSWPHQAQRARHQLALDECWMTL